jgi:6-pyruvoyltetrahydropterin/6-carboxytetrahydropterin synthase
MVRIEAAHSLDDMPEGHQCKRLHGHSYRIWVTLSREGLDTSGMVFDFGKISEIIKKFDHQNLNEFFAPTTAEKFCEIIWDRLEETISSNIRLDAVEVSETESSLCKLEN